MINKDVEKILLKVQKPGRYTGGEVNSIIKDKSQIEVRFAFCFPDVYEVGMSHLGMKILYSELNSKRHIWCERVFAPWIDMEEEMRKRKIPLFALESGDSLKEFDFIGFTLQYELSYTNILNMLNLAGIPILSKERTQLNNIVIAGGPCACNPEPLAEFIDIFCIGEGENIDIEIVDLYNECKKNGETKTEFFQKASQIEGIYVPSLYDVEYNDDNTIKSFSAKSGAPNTVKKHLIMDVDTAFYPENFVLPMIEIVHDRACLKYLCS
ncbi:hypothetical protein AGMMS50284_6140 [Clostridia bacterium]|nr:hypothetical protein AGMMS50284_6140 [Clostridia bacterium]